MRLQHMLVAGLAVVTLAAGAGRAQAQGKVVVSHDEWFTSVLGGTGADDQRFLENSLNWFGAAPGSNILIYSNNGFLTGGFVGFLSGLGFNPVVNGSESPANFSNYAAIFSSGPGRDAAGLDAYVFGGGNLFAIGGTGDGGGSAAEAAYTNTYLNPLGLGFANFYNLIDGNVNTAAFAGQGLFGAALFTGVNSVFADNGNDVLYATPVSGMTDQVFFSRDAGVFGAAQVTGTPEPGSMLLLATGLTGIFAVRRRVVRSLRH